MHEVVGILNGYYKLLKILPSIFCNKIEKSRNRDVNKIKEIILLMHSPSNHHQMDLEMWYQKADREVDEYLLNTYPDMDEQELTVCRTIVWTMWDLSSGGNEAFYIEVIARSITREDIFKTEKDIKETIQRLIHKGILAKYRDSINEFYPDRKITALKFVKDPGDVMRIIS